ncbi:MAG: hypothetical protein N2Z21_04515 [Candidatus Sumerlaeaceae bacterium]|nr:hypothetical protein [Candidatus Sumerlaeaceae bacterium]
MNVPHPFQDSPKEELSLSKDGQCFSRLDRWITLCDELSTALLSTSRNLVASECSVDERLDYLKELVTVGHRLFALERALADTPKLAGDVQPAPDEETFQPLLAQLIELAQKLEFPPHAGVMEDRELEKPKDAPLQFSSELADPPDGAESCIADL